MKKLMVVAAIAAVGSAFAVESSNIVGYSQSGLRDGACVQAPQFCAVGGGEIKITDIRPVGDFSSDEIAMDIIGFDGLAEENYVWIDWGGDGSEEGWSPWGGGEIESAKTFAAGTGFAMNGGATAALQSAGEITTKDVKVQLNGGAKAMGNPFPVPLTLADIVPTGVFDSDSISIDIIGNDGLAEANYVWINWGGDGSEEGWSPWGGGEIVTTDEIKAGQGFMVNGGSEDAYLQFAAPTF